MCCGGNSQKGLEAMDVDKSEWVEMAYHGTNGGPVSYRGYLRRSYRVKKGETVQVHPDDVKKLTRIVQKGRVLFSLLLEAETPDIVTIRRDDGINDEEASNAAAALAQRRQEINATDSAIREAAEAGLDLATVTGTGSGGRVTVADVRNAINANN